MCTWSYRGREKNENPEASKTNPLNENQNAKVALGSQTFFSPEEAAAALSRGWEQSGY